MGIMTTPDHDMLLVLIQSMRESFGEWRIAQIEHAFDLGLKGSLNIEMNLYNKPFNVVFLSSLMRAYRSFIAPAIRKSEIKLIEYKEPSDQEKKRLATRSIIASFDKYKSCGFILNPGNNIYESLSDRIQYDDEEFITEAKEQYRLELLKKNEQTEFGKLVIMALQRIKESKLNLTDDQKIARIIYDLKLKKFFDLIIEQDMHVIDIIGDEPEGIQ